MRIDGGRPPGRGIALTTAGCLAAFVLVGIAPAAHASGVVRTVDTTATAVATGSAESTTSLTLSSTTSTYGEDLAATATVTTAGGLPDGDVAFVVDGLATKSSIAPDGSATTIVRGLRTGVHTVVATFVPRDPTLLAGSSSAPQQVTVAQASTTTRIRVAGKRPARQTRVIARIRTAFDTTATGKVRIRLFRTGTRKRWAEVEELDGGRGSVSFGRLPKGRYRVVVTYRGDRLHLRSGSASRFRVRRG